jgi:hypothetical protein
MLLAALFVTVSSCETETADEKVEPIIKAAEFGKPEVTPKFQEIYKEIMDRGDPKREGTQEDLDRIIDDIYRLNAEIKLPITLIETPKPGTQIEIDLFG